MIDLVRLQQISAAANRAPSVHNTQPVRWRLENSTSILIACDLSRVLPAGDPTGRDAGLSCGAALEGTMMALGDLGVAGEVTDLWRVGDEMTIPGHRLAARIALGKGGKADPLNIFADMRFTWRDKFSQANAATLDGLTRWAKIETDVTVVKNRDDIAWLSALNDEASMRFFRDRSFRYELVNWMRLDPSAASYWADGLNREAMRMNALTGKAARLLLGTRLFNILDVIGLGKTMTSEGAKTRSASAIALFHRPADESPVTTGRHFYRFWLNLTRLGCAAWPMASLADNPDCAAQIGLRFHIAPEHRLVNVLRCGIAPEAPARKARLNAVTLIV